MAFMARALSLAGLLTTVKAVEYQEVTSVDGVNPTCAEMATAGEWRNPTEAQCQHYAEVEVPGGSFGGTAPNGAPCGCSTLDPSGSNNPFYYAPCEEGAPTTSVEFHNICVKTVLCKSTTCSERFLYWCQQTTVGFGSNDNEGPASSPTDILVAECEQCRGAANTDTCPTKAVRLYDAAPEAEPTSELDKNSVAVSVPLGLVFALAAMGGVIGVSRRRASNQPVLVEDEQDLLRE
ncbi:unnamed protein product [Prorocentrum cordatum]|uniref:Uncharacterized protein n=1 Tax=Prorocentrum cordatum TaxID=2364126 RepID=A0ABN9QVW3_9DINO|nr:unnamed protein product [Polarella glacialis]